MKSKSLLVLFLIAMPAPAAGQDSRLNRESVTAQQLLQQQQQQIQQQQAFQQQAIQQQIQQQQFNHCN